VVFSLKHALSSKILLRQFSASKGLNAKREKRIGLVLSLHPSTREYAHQVKALKRFPLQLQVKWRYCMRFLVPSRTSMKMAAFWDTAPCNVVEADQRFKDA
jgi:hypothetical protein